MAVTTIAIVSDTHLPRLTRMRRHFPDWDAVIFGHSHVPLHETDVVAGVPFQLFNPVSPTDRRRQPRHTMGVGRVSGADLGLRHVVL